MTTELVQRLKTAAQDEIMCRESCDTSDIWQADASPENILTVLASLEAKDQRIAELELALSAAENNLIDANCQRAELESRTVTVKLPGVEKWRKPDAVLAQNAFRILVVNELAVTGIQVIEGDER